MALLRRKKSSKPGTKISSATIITSCMQIYGDLKGSDTIHIDGAVYGDISVDNTFVIGKSGFVKGNVVAKHAIINGTLEGSIICDSLEVMQTGKVSEEVRAREIIIDGTLKGTATGTEKIEILESALVETDQVRSKNITVNGKLTGKIVAKNLLKIGHHGKVQGEIEADNVKVLEGGKIEDISQ